MEATGTLIADTSFLGDLVCAEPMVRAAVRQWPDEPVDFLSSPGGSGLLDGHPDLRELIVFDKRGVDSGPNGLLRAARMLRQRRYARVICSHRSWRTALLMRLAGIPERTAFHNAAGGWFYTHRHPYPRELHEVQRNLSLVRAAAGRNGQPPWERPRLFPSDSESSAAANFVEDGTLPVALAPGSIWATKRWPIEHYRKVAHTLTAEGQDLVIVGGEDDIQAAEELMEGAPGPGRILDLTGKLTVRGSYAVLERCALLLSNDSAPMHLGVAADIPVVAVYCSTVPAFGFDPRGPRDVVLEVADLACRPCGTHGHKSCPQQHFRCGRELSPERVLAAVKERLGIPA